MPQRVPEHSNHTRCTQQTYPAIEQGKASRIPTMPEPQHGELPERLQSCRQTASIH